ncbi:MAG: formate dehydrogenase accessory sulfurtransferase FdhD [Desulfobacterales bacterium]|nr:formate dehydrogenase accessory sulfurtransferase FdhD [Desulfobacterales bacterium]
MTSGNNTENCQALRCGRSGCRADSIELIGEEPLLIRIDEKPYSVVMRTPGQEMVHAAGFCLGEGIVDAADDFAAIGYCKDLDPNVIDVRLTSERRERISDLLDRRGFVSQTSCGICGKQMVKDLHQILTPADNGFQVDIDSVFHCMGQLFESQSVYPRTRGSHAAIVFDGHLKKISFAEDVGRHNALDKAVGQILMNGRLPDARLLVMSSRLSYELVQKAARARLPVMISKSRPTALAAEMGEALNMTLACVFGNSELIVVSGGHRIV